MRKRFSNLQVRMTLSYVIVSVLIILLFEILVSGLVYYALAKSPLLALLSQYRTQLIVERYALKLEAMGSGVTLAPQITFNPGQAGSLDPPGADFPRRSSGGSAQFLIPKDLRPRRRIRWPWWLAPTARW